MSSTSAELMLREHVDRFCAVHALDAGAVWVVACSGGKDSTALAAVLSARVRSDGGSLVLAHYDHALRPANQHDAERDAVRRLAERLEVPLVAEQAGTGELRQRGRQLGKGVEAAAREARYAFLDRVCREAGARYLATGHHADDAAETVVMRLIKGGGPVGLAGIPAVRQVRTGAGRVAYTVVRPLLGVRGDLLRRYCRSLSLGWAEDCSNQSTEYLRNAVRKRVIPALEAVEPDAVTMIAVASGKIRRSEEALAQLARQLIPWDDEPDGVSTSISGFCSRPSALRQAALYQAIHLVRASYRRAPLRATDPSADPAGELLSADQDPAPTGGVPTRFLAPLLEGSLQTGVLECDSGRKILLRGYGIVIEAGEDRLQVRLDIVRHRKKGYVVTVSRHFTAPCDFSVIIDPGMTDTAAPREGGMREVVFCGDTLSPPLLVRARRPGDRIQLPYGRKSLKKLFNESGIAESERSAVPVIEDRTGVVAVLAAHVGGEDLFRSDVTPVDGLDRSETRVIVRC